jgi:hypothetical protein
MPPTESLPTPNPQAPAIDSHPFSNHADRSLTRSNRSHDACFRPDPCARRLPRYRRTAAVTRMADAVTTLLSALSYRTQSWSRSMPMDGLH